MKQYLMVVNDNTLGVFSALFRSVGVEFLEISGMPLPCGVFNALVTPADKPVDVVDAVEPSEPSEPGEMVSQ